MTILDPAENSDIAPPCEDTWNEDTVLAAVLDQLEESDAETIMKEEYEELADGADAMSTNSPKPSDGADAMSTTSPSKLSVMEVASSPEQERGLSESGDCGGQQICIWCLELWLNALCCMLVCG